MSKKSKTKHEREDDGEELDVWPGENDMDFASSFRGLYLSKSFEKKFSVLFRFEFERKSLAYTQEQLVVWPEEKKDHETTSKRDRKQAG